MGTSTPGMWPPGEPARTARPRTPRARGLRIGALAVLVAAALGVCVWSASDPGGYTTSGNGCVSVSVASTMGGAMRRECGEAARSWCRSAYTQSDQFALLTQQQCELAGFGRETSTAP